jgi:hypothetical protein
MWYLTTHMEKQTKKTTTKKRVVKRSTTAKKKAVSTVAQEVPVETFNSPDVVSPEYMSPSVSTKKRFPYQYVLFAGLLLVVGFLFLNRNWFIAAIVNGQPIFRWELNTVLTSRYGQQTLETMVTEKLILSEAQKNNVSITSDKIEARANEILKQFGSSLTIDDFLKLQGLSRADFDNQLRIQMIIQELLTKDLKISESDITNFIATNSGSFVATAPAAIREEAKNAIIDSYVGERFQAWLQSLREGAKVQKL